MLVFDFEYPGLIAMLAFKQRRLERAMSRLMIRLLGSFQVSIAATPITKFESNKVRALLAYLAVEHDQAHIREQLADLLWPELPYKRAISNLNQALYNLRGLIHDHQAQPSYILRSHKALQFNPQSDYWLDVQAFSEQMADEDLQQLQAAVELYRGDFLAGLDFDSSLNFDEWVLVLRQRLQRQALGALHQLADYHAERGETAQALPYAWRQVELDPLDEAGCRQLMGLLAASDQRSQALSQFERLRVLLAQELAVAPAAETIELRERIRAEAPRPTEIKSSRENLPALLTPLVGRREELAALLGQCTDPDCRLLTILGPGGSGKTRLVLEVARASRAHFTHGVCFVPLNPLQSADSLLPAVVEALDLPRREGQDHQTLLSNYLRDKDLLLVLDGCEHLLAGAGALADLLHQAPGLKLLVTSRTRLNLKGEQLFPLPGMRYPQDSSSEAEILEADAVQLLIAGLRRARPEYQPEPADLKHLLQICRQVQGMPLAILLAASWGATLSVAEIAAEVSGDLDFLATDWADVPARQRSLRATYDHTWALLAERQQVLFQSLSVFRGAFSRGAARAVSGASPHELRALVERSLLWSSSPGWYEVHELLRQYGREQLSRSTELEKAVCHRHSAYYLAQLARLGDDLKSDRQPAALANLDLKHENYRAAWNWAAGQGDAARLDSALEALCLYYELGLRYPEGESACCLASERLAAGKPGEDQLRTLVKIQTWRARFHRLLGNPERARELHQGCLDQLDELACEDQDARRERAFLLLEMGNTIYHTDLESANRWHRESLELYRGLEDDLGTASALAGLGETALQNGRFIDSIACYEESLNLFRALGDPRGIARALTGLGGGLFRVGWLRDGEKRIRETIVLFEALDDRAGIATSQLNLARAFLWQGRYAEVTELFDACNPILKDLGLQYDQAYFLCISTLAYSHLEMYEKARIQAEELMPLCREIEYPRILNAAFTSLGMTALAQNEYRQARDYYQVGVDTMREVGQPDEQAACTGLLGGAYLKLGDLQLARQTLYQALQVSVELKAVWAASWTLPWVALFLTECGDPERAVEVYATATNLPIVANSRWYARVVREDIMAAVAHLSTQVVAAAEQRGRKLDLWQTAAKLLEELSVEVSQADHFAALA
jgi:DNA-binding SARP family transcriptional activator/predicted ATPase